MRNDRGKWGFLLVACVLVLGMLFVETRLLPGLNVLWVVCMIAVVAGMAFIIRSLFRSGDK